MSEGSVLESTATIHAENVGGISETEVELSPGVTVLAGRNATNRTSFLQAIMAAMGSDDVSLRGEADEGSVELTIGSDTYRRTLERRNGRVSTGGDPYLSDSTIADLFAFLLESNEARRAVVRGDDLRELIMRPVDTDEIQAEIDRLKRERADVDDRLATLDALRDDLPALERRRTELEAEIEETRVELADKEAEIEAMDADAGETRAEKRELESRLEDLRGLRSELERVRSEIELQEGSIESLRGERAELQEELERLPEAPSGDTEHLDREISRLRQRKRSLETKVRDLQNVVQFNEEMLSGEETVLRDVLGDDDRDGDAVTDRLVSDAPIVCWTCGNEVEPERMNETVEMLRSIRRDLTEDVREIEADLQEVRADKAEREERHRRREELERELAGVEDELDRRETRLEELRERRDGIGSEIETAEADVEALETGDFSAVLDRHREANQLEFELERLESDLDDVTDRVAAIEEQLAEREELEARRERIVADLETQQTRIDRIERRAVEEFNDHMAEVLKLLEYDNLARIWIERLQRTVREGRRNVERSVFELHVVRTTESGETYEDTIDHLSESEREVTGLTFALAGYLVHDVHESVPFMLLDSLEAIDSERLADLVSYFSGFADYLVVALLPEDAQALSVGSEIVSEI